MIARDRIILQKIVEYATDALEYTRESSFDSFMSDKKTVFACAFAIGQIGELTSNISEETRQAHGSVPWRNMRGMRNRIVHDYEHVDMVVLWGTLTKSLPELVRMLNSLLNQDSL